MTSRKCLNWQQKQYRVEMSISGDGQKRASNNRQRIHKKRTNLQFVIRKGNCTNVHLQENYSAAILGPWYVLSLPVIQLHSIAAYYPDEPTEEDKKYAVEFINSFAHLYPCKVCASHLKKSLAKYPPKQSIQSLCKVV